MRIIGCFVRKFTAGHWIAHFGASEASVTPTWNEDSTSFSAWIPNVVRLVGEDVPASRLPPNSTRQAPGMREERYRDEARGNFFTGCIDCAESGRTFDFVSVRSYRASKRVIASPPFTIATCTISCNKPGNQRFRPLVPRLACFRSACTLQRSRTGCLKYRRV